MTVDTGLMTDLRETTTDVVGVPATAARTGACEDADAVTVEAGGGLDSVADWTGSTCTGCE